MATDFAANSFSRFGRKTEQNPIGERACALNHGRAPDHGRGSYFVQYPRRQRLKPRSNNEDERQTIKTPHAKRGIEKAIGWIEQQGINEQATSRHKDFIPTLISCERPTFASRDAAGTKPVHQHKAGAGLQVKLLALSIARSRVCLDRIGSKNQN
jgi:hypothetical protein